MYCEVYCEADCEVDHEIDHEIVREIVREIGCETGCEIDRKIDREIDRETGLLYRITARASRAGDGGAVHESRVSLQDIPPLKTAIAYSPLSRAALR